MASNNALGEVHVLLQRILTSQEYSFNRLSKENKDNHLQVLDRFDKQVQQKSSIQIDNTDNWIDDQECPVDKSGEEIRLEIDNRARMYRENYPDIPLTNQSLINEANRTNQYEPLLTLETKNQEQEEQRGIRRPVREEIPASKQSPTYLVSVFFMGNRIEFRFQLLNFSHYLFIYVIPMLVLQYHASRFCIQCRV